MASPACEIKIAAAAYVTSVGGVNITPTATIVIRLTSQADVDSWSILCLTTDDLSVAATVTASLTIDSIAKTATFTAPVAGRAYRFQSKVNGGVNRNGVVTASYTTTFCLYTLTTGGHRVHALDETTEGGTFGYGADLNALIRAPAGSFAAPTGTGLMTVTSDAMDVASAPLGAGFLTFAATPSGANLASLLTTALPASKGGTGLTSLAAGIATFFGTPSGSNLAAALTTALPVTKGGTGLTALTIPASGLLVGATDTQTLTNKTLTAPTMSGPIVTTFVEFGGSGTPRAGAGTQRFPNLATAQARNDADTEDHFVWQSDADNYLTFGSNNAQDAASQFTQVHFAAAQALRFIIGASTKLYVDDTTSRASVPLIGNNTPYSVHGTVISAMTDAAYTVPADEYSYSQIEVPAALTLTGNQDFLLPTPATEGTSYSINVRNLTTGGFSLLVKRADGAGASVTLLTNTGAKVRVRPGGVYLESAAL